MPERTVYMTAATQRMAADTVTRYRQIEAALGAIAILDWAEVSRLPQHTEGGVRRCPGWEDMFLSDTCAPRCFDWFHTRFAEVPVYLRRLALRASRPRVSDGLGYPGPAPPGQAEATLAEILLARRRWVCLSFTFAPRLGCDMVREVRRGLIELQLYDRVADRWVWRRAAYDDRGTAQLIDKPRENGAPMLPLPRSKAWATVTIVRSISLRSDEPLDIDPVLQTLPFRDLTVPAAYRQAEETAVPAG
jgi:hypothetical protein